MSTDPAASTPASHREPANGTRLTIHWEKRLNELGDPLLWFASWLLAPTQTQAEAEGDAFYSGHGNETTAHPIPPDAVGARIRCWPSEALEAEYVDLALDPDATPLGELHTARLTFDSTQPHSHLPRPRSGRAEQ